MNPPIAYCAGCGKAIKRKKGSWSDYYVHLNPPLDGDGHRAWPRDDEQDSDE